MGCNAAAGGAFGLVTGGACPSLVAFAAVIASAFSVSTATTWALFGAAVISSVADVAIARALASVQVLLATSVEGALVRAQRDGAVRAFVFLGAVAGAIVLAVTIPTAVV